MVIIIRKYGQTCNRLFQYAHFYAFCRANAIKLLNPSFHDLREYFTYTEADQDKAFPVKIKYLLKSLLCCIKGRLINIDTDEKNLLARTLFMKSDYLVWGWNFRDNENFVKYSDEIRRFFEIKADMVEETHHELINKRTGIDKIIGVHVRRGDYKVWCDGKYYYDDDAYLSYINQLANLMPAQKLLFIICSNEPLDHTKYKSIGNENISLWIPQKNFINELYLLSKCDRIIGPPSTFTLWASFSGNVPYLHITDREFEMDLQDFKMCNG